MYTFANTLLTKLAKLDCATVAQQDNECYTVTVDLGTGWAGDYEGGHWADTVRITDDNLQLQFVVLGNGAQWSEDEEYSIGEGTVALHYADYGSGNLAYTSALEAAINEAVRARTLGILACDGSEQGMQGYDSEHECYLSLDVAEVEEAAVPA